MATNPASYEPHPNPQALTSNANPEHNSSSGVDYEPHPEISISISPERKKLIDSIMRLYSGSASEEDMQGYAEKVIYDDPWSYCDTRYKIAGQWYGMFIRAFVFHVLSSTGRASRELGEAALRHDVIMR
jgi:hypothetical protein